MAVKKIMNKYFVKPILNEVVSHTLSNVNAWNWRTEKKCMFLMTCNC